MRYAQILNRVYNQPWAILPDKLEVIDLVVQMRVAGDRLSETEVREAMGAASRPVEGRQGMTAVLPLFGTIVQHAGLFTEWSGGTSTDAFAKSFRLALADPQVDRIVINTHSPGGTIYGVQELSTLIYQSRGQKPIVAVANSLMASAAYWIASAADEIVATPGGDVGSIGVLAMHTDVSKAEAMAGLKTTLVAKPERKILGHPFEPLSDEARADIQASVEATYDEFVAAVARNRGASKAEVRNGYAGGGVVNAKEALAQGMIDRIATLDEVLSGDRRRGARRRAAAALRLSEASA